MRAELSSRKVQARNEKQQHQRELDRLGVFVLLEWLQRNTLPSAAMVEQQITPHLTIEL